MQPSVSRQLLKHSAIAIAVGLASIATVERAAAFTAFETPSDRLIINGRIGGLYQWNKGGTSENAFDNNGSRINLVYEHHFDENWTALARTEWGFNPFFQNGDDEHFKRHQYVGISHPVYGTVTVGKQYSSFYDLIGVNTDQLWFWGGEASQSYPKARSGDFVGLTRPFQSLKYAVTMDRWKLSTTYGTTRGGLSNPGDAERKYFGQFAASYDAGNDVHLFGGYNHSRIDVLQSEASTDRTRDANINNWEGGANWAPNNWYMAVIGGESRNVFDTSGSTWQNAEAYAGYTIPAALGELGDLRFYSAYNYAKQKGGDGRIDKKVVGVSAITFHEQFIVALEHMWNDNKLADGSDKFAHDTTGLLLRYNY